MGRPDPPYLRIAEDLRRRIDAGDLHPGDRVPSARAITREWGVAIATATKVLTTLRQEGLVRVVPGVGTVVAAARPPRPRRRERPDDSPDLNRQRIVRTAMDIADAEGMAALSMRRVATDLDVATMSLYRHVRNRDELILFMIDEAIGEEAFPATPPDGWRARLELEARLQWKGFRRHRWLGPVMSVTRPQFAPQALTHTEWSLRALEGLGLDAADMLHIHVMLFSYVRGLATTLEAEAEAEQDTGMTSDEWMSSQEAELDAVAGSGSFASFLSAIKESSFEFDLDTLFEFGLLRLLDGLAVYLDARPPRP